jgi:hypothetical protein
MIESDFNTLDDLKELFYSYVYNGIVLGVKSGNKLATVQQKKPYKGVCGWSITYGVDLKRAIHAVSKATDPSKFETSLLCSANYAVETL